MHADVDAAQMSDVLDVLVKWYPLLRQEAAAGWRQCGKPSRLHMPAVEPVDCRTVGLGNASQSDFEGRWKLEV
eukprot:1194605-Prorocentrum_minimum.AAC.1